MTTNERAQNVARKVLGIVHAIKDANHFEGAHLYVRKNNLCSVIETVGELVHEIELIERAALRRARGKKRRRRK